MSFRTLLKALAVLLVAAILVVYGVATREPPQKVEWISLVTVGIILWGEWSKRRPDYEEHPHDRYLPASPIISFLLYLATGSFWYYLLGGLGYGLGWEIIRGDSFGRMREEEANVRRFLEDACVVDGVSQVGAGMLYGAFVDWSRRNGMKPLQEAAYGRRLKSEGIIRVQDDGEEEKYQGCKLLHSRRSDAAEENLF